METTVMGIWEYVWIGALLVVALFGGAVYLFIKKNWIAASVTTVFFLGCGFGLLALIRAAQGL
jgi:hypothetical protein